MQSIGAAHRTRWRALPARAAAVTAMLMAGAALAAEAKAPFKPDASTPSNKTIIEHFDIIAFGNEYTGRRYDAVRKWRAPIIARIDGPVPDYFEAFVNQHLDDLQKITGHPAALACSPRILREKRVPKGLTSKSFNMFLLYYPIDQLMAVAQKQLGNRMDDSLKRLSAGASTCEATLFTKDNEIRSAVVLFPAERPKNHMRACVVEELTQILGLPNDSPSVSPSIFNDKSPINELTDHDRLMLRVLYDPRITIGMARDRALIVGRKVLDEIRPE
ncbi:MAG: DUF2927 domain-containing protein [Rhodospirillales bacterium]|nr:DUF2927 domain-containing protein [Rhodospirillales bacterium]